MPNSPELNLLNYRVLNVKPQNIAELNAILHTSHDVGKSE